MAGRGPAPKESRSRKRAEAPVLALAPDEALRGPELPDSHEWPDMTHRWWDTLRRSAQAQTWIDTDWMTLLEVAVLHANFWLGDTSVAAELRLRSAKYALTPEDRMRMRISVGEPAAAPAARPASKASRSRRESLLRAVGDGA